MSFDALPAADRTVHLRLIETTDLHLHLLPYDYYTDQPNAAVGLAAAAGLIEAARAEVPNALLFDNGDFLQGTPMGDYLAYERGLREGDLHPVMAAMNALRFDAITLGNHEFNYGLGFLMKAIAGARCPVVSANLLLHPGTGPRTDRTLVPPYALLDRVVTDAAGRRHPIRIGVVGVAPPQVVGWDRHALEGRLWSRDMVEAARDWVPEMREAGADLIFALAHSGIGSARHSEGMENAVVPLARIDGIDALLAGHSHLLFPSPLFDSLPDVDARAGTIAGKPVVMGGCWGAHIGLIDLLVQREGGKWRVLGSRSETRALPPAPPRAGRAATRVEKAIAPIHSETLRAIRRPVGLSRVALHTYFAHLGVTAALSVVAEAQRTYVAERLNDPALAELPILSAAAPFKAGGRSGPAGYTDIPAGPLALRHIADLYAFPNAIAALRLTGAEVLEWLERSAAAFNRIRPGSRDTLLRNPEVPGYNFEVIDGLEVLLDLSQPARYDANGTCVAPASARVAEVRFGGAPLDPKQEFVLCTNSYRAGGAGGFVDPDARRALPIEAHVTRDLVRSHVARLATVEPASTGGLRFAPLPQTAALFETGPGAGRHLAEIAGFAPEPRGLTRSGFLRLRIDLSGGA